MKACPSCGSRNEERSQFCNDCGTRLPGEESAPAHATESTGAADPRTASMHGVHHGGLLGGAHRVPPAPAAPPVPSPATPPPRAPASAGACASCGAAFPAGSVVSWCPACGALVDSSRVPSRATTPPGMGAPPPPGAAVPQGWALVLLKAGERLDRYPLRKVEMVLGRTEGDYVFPEDPLLSPRHAKVAFRGPGFQVEDLGSRNGVYLRLRGPSRLAGGDLVNLGSLVLRYESAGPGPRVTGVLPPAGIRPFGSGRERPLGRLVRILQDGSDGPAYPLVPSRTILGRKTGHFLFPDDPLLSRQHAQFYERDGEMWVEDLGSSNGTLLRVRGPAPLEKGAVLRIGDVTLEVQGP